MTPRLLFTGVVVGVLLAVAAPAAAAENFPTFTRPVVDTANAVPSSAQEQVSAELIDYQARSGNQIAVAVVERTGGRSIEDYTIDLARAWGVGQKGKDNGILLVIATGDRKLRIEVGRGLEGTLTDLQSGRIIRERLVPLLERGEVSEAVIQGTRAIRAVLGDSEVGSLPPALGTGPRDTGGAARVLLPVALFGFGALALLARRRGGRSGHGHGSGSDDAMIWGALLGLGLGGHGGRGGAGGFGGFGGGGGGGFGGGGASGDW